MLNAWSERQQVWLRPRPLPRLDRRWRPRVEAVAAPSCLPDCPQTLCECPSPVRRAQVTLWHARVSLANVQQTSGVAPARGMPPWPQSDRSAGCGARVFLPEAFLVLGQFPGTSSAVAPVGRRAGRSPSLCSPHHDQAWLPAGQRACGSGSGRGQQPGAPQRWATPLPPATVSAQLLLPCLRGPWWGLSLAVPLALRGRVVWSWSRRAPGEWGQLWLLPSHMEAARPAGSPEGSGPFPGRGPGHSWWEPRPAVWLAHGQPVGRWDGPGLAGPSGHGVCCPPQEPSTCSEGQVLSGTVQVGHRQ